MCACTQLNSKFRTCPHDGAHRCKASRLQIHIVKDHLDSAKEVCPFNATHLLEHSEFDHHLINCPDRSAFDRHLAQSHDKNNLHKGQTAVPMPSDPILEADEDWELGEACSAASIVSVLPPPGAIWEVPEMLKPAERKKLYKDLHQLQSKPENSISSPATKPVPRQPKQQSKTQKLQNVQQTNAHATQNLGLGRGRPSRIAASIFGEGHTRNTSYSNIVKDMSNPGVGQGLSASQAAFPVYNDSDFPALGCGRGFFASS